MSPEGWVYRPGEKGSDAADPVFGFTKIRDLYFKMDPDYKLRFTVPILMDKKTKKFGKLTCRS